MRRRKKCRCCGRLYRAHPQTYRQQKTCDKPACRGWRSRRKWRLWQRNHPWRGERYGAQQAAWRARHGGYWRQWRGKHPGYVEGNRRAQKRRNRENRGGIAKPTAWRRIRREELRRIERLRLIAKPTASPGVQALALDGIVRYLEWRCRIAKPTGMDLSP